MRRALAACCVVALAVAGCGGDDDSDAGTGRAAATPTPGETPGAERTASPDPLAPPPDHDRATWARLTMGADDELAFSERVIGVKGGGTLTLSARNASTSADHALAIRGGEADLEGNVAAPGETSTVELQLPPGRYVFYCPVGTHEQAGMRGRLIIR